MKTPRILFSVFLAAVFGSETCAQENFAESFLRRYRPPAGAAARRAALPAPPEVTVATLLQGGALPLTMGDVVAMMIEHNLDVRANRLSPRSAAFQTRVLRRTSMRLTCASGSHIFDR